jgi:hypothetical protein
MHDLSIEHGHDDLGGNQFVARDTLLDEFENISVQHAKVGFLSRAEASSEPVPSRGFGGAKGVGSHSLLEGETFLGLPGSFFHSLGSLPGDRPVNSVERVDFGYWSVATES